MGTEIDSERAHASRIYDYLLGGSDNFLVDREAAEYIFSAYPGGVEAVRVDARANRDFLVRSVRHLVGEAGLRQVLDIGTGIPNGDNAHAIAYEMAPDCRVVYVDNDPIVLAHAHELLRGHPEGHTDYIDGDLTEPAEILRRAAKILDFSRPVAVLLIGVLHVIPDSANPRGIIRTLMEAMPSGSYLAVSQLCNDVEVDNMTEVGRRLDQALQETNPPQLRSRAEITAFFDGLELVDPGPVPVDHWRADSIPGARGALAFCGVGRKP